MRANSFFSFDDEAIVVKIESLGEPEDLLLFTVVPVPVVAEVSEVLATSV